MSENTFHSRPAVDLFSITPSDSADLSRPARGLYVGTAGDVKITTLKGTEVTLPNLAAGVVHPIGAIKVFSTGTDAVDIFGVTTD